VAVEPTVRAYLIALPGSHQSRRDIDALVRRGDDMSGRRAAI